MIKRALSSAVFFATIAGGSSFVTIDASSAATPPKLNSFPEGERLIYGRILEAFRKNKVDDAKRQREILARNYPKSIHLDNAYYLSGVLEFQNGNLAEAVRDFGVVTERFPQSNKRSSALFAKAMTYDKLNLRAQAVTLWDKIVVEYPGSQDAKRAKVQLELKSLKR